MSKHTYNRATTPVNFHYLVKLLRYSCTKDDDGVGPGSKMGTSSKISSDRTVFQGLIYHADMILYTTLHCWTTNCAGLMTLCIINIHTE